ncbi:MAG TPA: hypothetical protein VN958_02030, partial [Chitinophagaceae bacterium]|nr:hypothetical protein [Chitinophagaceae bacterium]
ALINKICSMKKIITVALLIISTKYSFAQSQPQSTYHQAIGIKFPGGFSVTYKQFVTASNNLEAQATIWNKGFRLSGLYEFNFYSFDKVDGLAWFLGPGVHLGFWKDQYQKDYDSKADFGIDGIIGLDYKFRDVPVNVSIDWQPAVTLVGSAGFTPSYGGIGVRYTF